MEVRPRKRLRGSWYDQRTEGTSFAFLDVEINPGLIVVREGGLSREEQWAHVLPLIEFVKNSGGSDFLINKLVEVLAPGRWEIRDIPEP